MIEVMVHDHERIGAVDPRKHGRVVDDRQDLARHIHHDLIGVAVGQESCERTAAGHAVAPGVVDHDQVDAAGFLALGR